MTIFTNKTLAEINNCDDIYQLINTILVQYNYSIDKINSKWHKTYKIDIS